jgi:tRNA (cmo5U34)-methyltransferase
MEGGWTEADSREFLTAATVVTPSRAEVLDLFAALVPAAEGEAFSAVELCCGGGDLGRRLLEAFPRMSYLGLDGSDVMLEAAARRLSPHASQVELRPFRLEAADWRAGLPEDLALVVSSLAIHHLDAAGKRQLYRDVYRSLRPGGALLVFDLVMPTTPAALAATAAAWSAVVREQSLALTGSDAAYREFVESRSNIYDHPDPADMPDPLYAQLGWLSEAGFGHVDAFWQRAGHALFGGHKALAH